MILQLTDDQLILIQNEVKDLEKEMKDLREKRKTEDICGWEFVCINNKIVTLKDMLESKLIETDYEDIEDEEEEEL